MTCVEQDVLDYAYLVRHYCDRSKVVFRSNAVWSTLAEIGCMN